MKRTLEEYCLQTGRPLLAEWDWDKNTDISPAEIGARSHKRAWWICSQGHSWNAIIASRTAPKPVRCPFCAGKTVLPGHNDLETIRPDIAAEWDSEKNGSLMPRQVTAHSASRAWWRCAKGHSWSAKICSRTSSMGPGCPVCAGRAVLAGYNDLATLRPQLVPEWDTQHNNGLTPEQVTVSSNRKVWWQCSKGHYWQAAIHSRTRTPPTGCPVCAGNIPKKKQQMYQRIIDERVEQSRKHHEIDLKRLLREKQPSAAAGVGCGEK